MSMLLALYYSYRVLEYRGLLAPLRADRDGAVTRMHVRTCALALVLSGVSIAPIETAKIALQLDKTNRH